MTALALAVDDADSSPQKLQQAEVLLNPAQLDLLLQSAAVITLLKASLGSNSQSNAFKAKAEDILSSSHPRLAFTERVLYNQCAEQSATASRLAKCVVKLLEARADVSGGPSGAAAHEEVDLFTKLKGLILSVAGGGSANKTASLGSARHRIKKPQWGLKPRKRTPFRAAKRRRRAVSSQSHFPNIQKLQRIQRFYQMVRC